MKFTKALVAGDKHFWYGCTCTWRLIKVKSFFDFVCKEPCNNRPNGESIVHSVRLDDVKPLKSRGKSLKYRKNTSKHFFVSFFLSIHIIPPVGHCSRTLYFLNDGIIYEKLSIYHLFYRNFWLLMAFAKYWNNLWTVVFGSTALVITIANLVTVVVFLKQKLRKRSHFSLISLAIADLMVGALAVPLYVVVAGFQTDEKLLVVFFQCVDIFTGLLSIFTLASISLERMHSVLWPLRHRAVTSRFYSSVVGIPWVLAALATSFRLMKRFNIIAAMTLTVIMIVFLSAPSLVICTAYFLIYSGRRKCRLKLAQRDARNDRLTKTLLIITGAFMITWLPFHIINFAFPFCSVCQRWPYIVFHIVKYLQFSNSFINALIYPLRIRQYKKALIALLFRCTCSREHFEKRHTSRTRTQT